MHDMRQFKHADALRQELAKVHSYPYIYKEFKNVDVKTLFRMVNDEHKRHHLKKLSYRESTFEFESLEKQVKQVKIALNETRQKLNTVTEHQEKKREAKIAEVIKIARNKRKRPNKKKLEKLSQLTVTEQYLQDKVKLLDDRFVHLKAKFDIQATHMKWGAFKGSLFHKM